MPHYQSLSSQERNCLEDALAIENLCIAKCGVYADQCQDQALRSLLADVAKTKRQHANRLKQVLGEQAGLSANRQQYQ